MRNLKKLLAVVVAICVLATFTLPAFAADAAALSADTKTCADIGVLVGTGSAGVTAEYGLTTPTRAQAAVMVLRLTGNLAAAQAYTGTENFADADTVSWAAPLMGYLKTHPELGFVGDGTNFKPADKITAQEYYKVILTALGYAIPADYAFADTLTFAKDTVKLAMAGNVESFTIDALAAATVEGLKGAVKGGTKTLAATLVDAKALDAAAAEAAGLYSSIASATASQTGAKTLTVTFNRALTAAEKTAATFSVKNGMVAYTVTPTWAADNASVVLAYAYNLYAGDYTITVGGITDPLTAKVVDEKVTKITINSDYLAKTTASAIDYTVLNQFNEKMENQTLSINAYNATKGLSYTVSSDKVDLSGADKDNVIIITISHYATGISVTKSVPVNDSAAAKTMQFGTVAPLSGDSRIFVSKTGYTLPYTFADQYAKALKLAEYTTANADAVADTENIGGIKFMTSDAAIVDPDTFKVDSDGVLTFNTGSKDGTVIISALAPATGAVATVSIKVEAGAVVKTLTISNPGKLVAAGDSVAIPYSAVDSFGAPIAQKDFTYAKRNVTGSVVTFVSSNTTALPTANITWNGKNEILIAPAASGTVTIYPSVGGVLQNSITIDVKELAVPTRVAGIKDVPTLFQALGSDNIKMENLNVIDQYNRPIDLGTYNSILYQVVVAYDGGSGTKVALGGTLTINDSNDEATIAGVAEGSENLIFSLFKVGTADAISTFKTTAKTLKDDDITGYSVDTISTIWGDASTSGSAYAVTPKLLGKDASGNAVTMNQGIITAVTSSNTALVGVETNNKVIFGTKAGTATVAIWKGATKLAETAVTVSEEARYAAKAEFDATSYTVATTKAITLTVKDQYGVAIGAPVGTWSTSDANVATVVPGTITARGVGTATISYVTNTGIVVSAEVVVN